MFTKIIGVIFIFCLGSTICFAQNRIIVSKERLKLYVLNSNNDTLYSMPCSVGFNKGDKKIEGDKKTPEGVFSVTDIHDSNKWTHDFNDGAGEREGAYGPWFIRLETAPFTGIGIHGTCFPESTGTRSSNGCIRLKNEDVTRLVRLVKKGTKVYIEKDSSNI